MTACRYFGWYWHNRFVPCIVTGPMFNPENKPVLRVSSEDPHVDVLDGCGSELEVQGSTLVMLSGQSCKYGGWSFSHPDPGSNRQYVYGYFFGIPSSHALWTKGCMPKSAFQILQYQILRVVTQETSLTLYHHGRNGSLTCHSQWLTYCTFCGLLFSFHHLAATNSATLIYIIYIYILSYKKKKKTFVSNKNHQAVLKFPMVSVKMSPGPCIWKAAFNASPPSLSRSWSRFFNGRNVRRPPVETGHLVKGLDAAAHLTLSRKKMKKASFLRNLFQIIYSAYVYNPDSSYYVNV